MKRFRVRIKCTFPEDSREGLAYTTVLEQSKFHQADRTTVENVSILSTPTSPFEDWGKEETCPLEDIGQGYGVTVTPLLLVEVKIVPISLISDGIRTHSMGGEDSEFSGRKCRRPSYRKILFILHSIPPKKIHVYVPRPARPYFKWENSRSELKVGDKMV
ncbi:hypothetical protein TNCV_3134301 [Trichonephila clavipes]|nr:hypothetical protein TNCV_3134301 [Trichonephila clavipes]